MVKFQKFVLLFLLLNSVGHAMILTRTKGLNNLRTKQINSNKNSKLKTRSYKSTYRTNLNNISEEEGSTKTKENTLQKDPEKDLFSMISLVTYVLDKNSKNLERLFAEQNLNLKENKAIGASLLEYAKKNNAHDVIDILRINGAMLNNSSNSEDLDFLFKILSKAVINNDYALLYNILEVHKEKFPLSDYRLNELLEYAFQHEKFETAIELLKSGAVPMSDHEYVTPFMPFLFTYFAMFFGFSGFPAMLLELAKTQSLEITIAVSYLFLLGLASHGIVRGMFCSDEQKKYLKALKEFNKSR